MNEKKKNRREFLATVGAAGAASIVAGSAGASASFAAEDDATISVGVARIDITPDGPIRLHGFGRRKTESA